MTENVEIGRFAARYRLRPSQFGARPRLDALMRELTTDAMETALEGAGIRRGEIVCLRSVHVPVRLRLSGPDSALVAEWARALAEAIAEAAASGEVVRYGSRAAGLIDMGASIAQGRFQPVWAWRQIGFWRASQVAPSLAAAVGEFVAALLREPESIVAVLSTLARQRQVHVLAPHLEGAWEPMAAAVVMAAGISFTEVAEVVGLAGRETGGFFGGPESHAPVDSMAQRRASRTAEHSGILRDVAASEPGERSALAIAVLALLECEPALVRAPKGELRDAAIALQRLFCGVAERGGVTPRPHGQGHRDRTISTRPDAIAPAAVDVEYRTEFGGLLFLLRIVDELRIPERALTAPLDRTGESASRTLLARSFTWFLHRLALALQPLEENDPAALAFCGLAPYVPSPSRGEPVPSIDEQRLIGSFAEEIRRSAAAALPQPPRSPEALIQFICRRRARVLADPGWIELRLALRDVSTEIRRAGLDLDPNYVPWLGVVVRFVYE